MPEEKVLNEKAEEPLQDAGSTGEQESGAAEQAETREAQAEGTFDPKEFISYFNREMAARRKRK